MKVIDAKFKVIKPKTGWRIAWSPWPLIGAAVLGLPALLKALIGP